MSYELGDNPQNGPSPFYKHPLIKSVVVIFGGVTKKKTEAIKSESTHKYNVFIIIYLQPSYTIKLHVSERRPLFKKPWLRLRVVILCIDSLIIIKWKMYLHSSANPTDMLPVGFFLFFWLKRALLNSDGQSIVYYMGYCIYWYRAVF